MSHLKLNRGVIRWKLPFQNINSIHFYFNKLRNGKFSASLSNSLYSKVIISSSAISFPVEEEIGTFRTIVSVGVSVSDG